MYYVMYSPSDTHRLLSTADEVTRTLSVSINGKLHDNETMAGFSSGIWLD